MIVYDVRIGGGCLVDDTIFLFSCSLSLLRRRPHCLAIFKRQSLPPLAHHLFLMSKHFKQHLVNILDKDKFDALLDRGWHVFVNVRLATGRDDELFDASAVGGQDLFFEAADGEHLAEK